MSANNKRSEDLELNLTLKDYEVRRGMKSHSSNHHLTIIHYL